MIGKNIDDFLSEEQEQKNFLKSVEQQLYDYDTLRMKVFHGRSHHITRQSLKIMDNCDKMVPKLDLMKKEFDKAFKQLNKELFCKR